MFFVSCVSHAFASVHCCLVVNCWETGLTFWLLLVMFIVFLLLSNLVSWVRCVLDCIVSCSLLPCGLLREMAELSALVGDIYRIFVTFPLGILGQVWYLIVSFPVLCRLSYFEI